MSIFLKLFNTTAEYNAYTADTANFIKPNVSLIVDNNAVHYNPWVETRVVAKFDVTDTSSPTQIGYNAYTSGFSAIEIDGVELPSVVSAYTFSSAGEHTVKYTLTDPTSIGNNAFRGCSGLTSIVMLDSVTSIGNQAFYGCRNLVSIDIPSGVTSIGDYAFNGCSGLTSIDIPNSVTSICYGAFQGCSGLTSIDIPNSVTSISQQTFSGCSSLTSCTIGSGVTSIGASTFAKCSSLTSIVIPDNVTSIGISAFEDCYSLSSITSNAMTAPTIQVYTFRGVKTGGTLTVPSGSSGYDVWMGTGGYYLGYYNWTKVEQ